VKKMGLKLDLKGDPNIPKVVFIAILLFIESIAIQTYLITQQGRFPTEIELVSFFLSAVIQVVTYLLTFLGYKKEEYK